MDTLILDTSTSIMYIALINDLVVVDNTIKIGQKDHGKYLVEEIRKLLEKNNRTIDDINEIIVGSGPGSYTGTRVAVMVAKMLSYSKKITLKQVSSLFLLTSGYDDRVAVAINAKNDNFFVGIRRNEKEFEDFFLNKEEFTKYNIKEIKVIDENNYKINPEEIIKMSKLVLDLNNFSPNYIRKTEAERNYDKKDE